MKYKLHIKTTFIILMFGVFNETAKAQFQPIPFSFNQSFISITTGRQLVTKNIVRHRLVFYLQLQLYYRYN